LTDHGQPDPSIAALSGVRALVTGANRGIGACFVDALMHGGAAVVYAGARDVASLDPLRRQYGDRLVPVRLDMTEPAHIDDFCAGHDDVSLLVSNAGRDGTGSVLTQDEADVRDLFEVHTFGPWRLAAGLAPQLREHRGGIIFVHSAAALVLSRRGPFYSASKAAGWMLAAAMREALRADGVRVTSVFPGFTDTDMVRSDDIVKASPADVAARSLRGWADDEPCVFPDRFAELVHEQLVTDMQRILDEPTAVVTETVARYAAGE
jgi:NAD(P)-dependent dehydrogenase (short-subunit alcohol dehydrogenase family)